MAALLRTATRPPPRPRCLHQCSRCLRISRRVALPPAHHGPPHPQPGPPHPRRSRLPHHRRHHPWQSRPRPPRPRQQWLQTRLPGRPQTILPRMDRIRLRPTPSLPHPCPPVDPQLPLPPKIPRHPLGPRRPVPRHRLPATPGRHRHRHPHHSLMDLRNFPDPPPFPHLPFPPRTATRRHPPHPQQPPPNQSAHHFLHPPISPHSQFDTATFPAIIITRPDAPHRAPHSFGL